MFADRFIFTENLSLQKIYLCRKFIIAMKVTFAVIVIFAENVNVCIYKKQKAVRCLLFMHLK